MGGQIIMITYWADITSTYIHPIGWCEKNGQTLLPPKGDSEGNWLFLISLNAY